MKNRNLPAAVLVLAGGLSILLGTWEPFHDAAIILWAVGMLFFIAAMVAAVRSYSGSRQRTRHPEGHES